MSVIRVGFDRNAALAKAFSDSSMPSLNSHQPNVTHTSFKIYLSGLSAQTLVLGKVSLLLVLLVMQLPLITTSPLFILDPTHGKIWNALSQSHSFPSNILSFRQTLRHSPSMDSFL